MQVGHRERNQLVIPEIWLVRKNVNKERVTASQCDCSMSKKDGNTVCLGDFGPPPCFAVLPLTMLKKHHVESESICNHPEEGNNSDTSTAPGPTDMLPSAVDPMVRDEEDKNDDDN